MRVLHVSTADSWRGGEQQIAYLVKNLPKNVESVIVCVRNSPMAQFCHENGIKHHCLPKNVSLKPYYHWRFKKIVANENVDLIHTHDSHGHTLSVFASLFFGLKKPLVVHRRVDFPPKNSPFTRWKYTFKWVKRIVCVSNNIKGIMQDYLGYEDRLKTIYSAIDSTKFNAGNIGESQLKKEFNLDTETILVGNTSALADHKDYPTFLRVAAELKDYGQIHFFIIGEGKEREKLQKLAKGLDVESTVTFTGFRTDLKKILPELDVFLFTSKEEGLGTSVLDALAAKVPVVCTAGGGVPEIISHENNGLICNVGDVQSHKNNVLRIINSPELRDKLVEGGTNTLTRFSLKEMATETYKEYQKILDLNS